MNILLQLFWSFFKIGSFTFGSGYAMIPMIEQEIIDKKGWFDKEDFRNQFALAQSSPGPVALNTAVFVGYKMRGFAGALAAVLGAVIPSFTIILLIVIFLSDFKGNPYVEAAFKGVRPAVVALIAVPFVRWITEMKWYFALLALAVSTIIWQLGISPIYFIIAGFAIGICSTFYKRKRL